MPLKQVQRKNPDGTLTHEPATQANHSTTLAQMQAADASAVSTMTSNMNSALSGKEPSIATGLASQFWNGLKQWVSITKSTIGLGNVDNTADIAKPVSTAMQAAIDKLKPYPINITIGASGQQVIYLTDNGLAGGNAIFSLVMGVSIDFTSNNPNFGKSYTLSVDLKTLTVYATQQTFSTGLAGLLSVLTGASIGAAPSGTTLTGFVVGVRNS